MSVPKLQTQKGMFYSRKLKLPIN